jgi:Ca2+-binding EF-hand superfamily protein
MGITYESFRLIMSKKMKDEDVQSDLTDAFNFVSDNDENSMISSEKMLDLLVYNGYRYTEEQAEIFMK